MAATHMGRITYVPSWMKLGTCAEVWLSAET